MLVLTPEGKRTLLDFFVAAPGRGGATAPATLVPIDVSFGDANQIFHVGPASVGVWGVPAGICRAVDRFGSLPLAEIVRPAVDLAREGVETTAIQAYVSEILGPIVLSTPECAAIYAPEGKLLGTGDVMRQPELADTLELLAREGSDPFYRGDFARAAVGVLDGHGGLVTAADLEAYEVIEREPIEVSYRGRKVLTNPPPSAGGILIAYALALLEADRTTPTDARLVDVMETVQAERTLDFLEGLDAPDFQERFLASKLGSTTHISVVDDDGWACSVTCSNGEGSGVVVPGTGIQLNNMLGEEDLNPLGFHRHPPGRRLPSMMAPTAVVRGGRPELVVGSAGSNRLRSAILQTIVNVIDRKMSIVKAIDAPRVHFENGIVYAEPGAAPDAHGGRERQEFRAINLFFGGVQGVARSPVTGGLSGHGDPRRGGAATAA
jgi:gamma-glutamyltranspeptidase/glutathione hydrolase